MKIVLKKLSITSFKGIKNFEVDLPNFITNIYGENATGKTTVVDAFLWLFFGKNSEEVTKFEIKPLDEAGRFIEKQETEVKALVYIDDQEIEVKKVLRQKWVKKRGSLSDNYEGDENIYYWNEVPLKEGEFKNKVKEIIDEGLFRLITNPFHFNSLKWEERRNILIQMSEVTDAETITALMLKDKNPIYNQLLTALNQKKSIKEFKAEIAAKRKKIKDEAESIPSRIDEVRRGTPEQINFDAIRTDINTHKEELKRLTGLLTDQNIVQDAENAKRSLLQRSAYDKKQARQTAIFDLKTKLQNAEFEAKQKAGEASAKLQAEINGLQRQIADKEADLNRAEALLPQVKQQLTDKQTILAKLREDYVSADATVLKFDDNNFNCPACKQSLPDGDVDTKKQELTANFNKDKIAKLEGFSKRAAEVKLDITTLEERIANGSKFNADLKTELDELKAKLTGLLNDQSALADKATASVEEILQSDAAYVSIKNELAVLEATVIEEPVFEPIANNENLKNEWEALSNKIATLNTQLNDEAVIDKANIRIHELKETEVALAANLAELEGVEYAILQFTKAKVESIEQKLNSKFKFVKFKMFHVANNGGEQETCETLVNSNGSYVPYSDANNAARINSGIDIINGLCKHYNVSAPIFIDNRESVSMLIDSNSQIVNLIVSAADKKLRVA